MAGWPGVFYSGTWTDEAEPEGERRQEFMTKDSSNRRMIRNFNHDWLFKKADDPSFSEPGLDDSTWRRLNLPHDFSIETVPDEENKTGSGGGYTGAGCGWYRKHFEYDPSFEGRLVSILFDGILYGQHHIS